MVGWLEEAKLFLPRFRGAGTESPSLLFEWSIGKADKGIGERVMHPVLAFFNGRLLDWEGDGEGDGEVAFSCGRLDE